MKKKILGIAMVIAIALAAGWNFSQSKSDVMLSDIVLSNVEALADSENPMCPNGCVSDGGGCHCYTWYPTYREHGTR